MHSDSTTLSWPRTMSPPVLPRRMRSSPSRRAVPGATAASVARMQVTLWPVGGRHATPRTGRPGRRECNGQRAASSLITLSGRGVDTESLRNRSASWRSATSTCWMPCDRRGAPLGHEGAAEPQPGRLAEPRGQPAHRPHLTGEADLAERHQVAGQRPVAWRRRRWRARPRGRRPAPTAGRRRRWRRRRRSRAAVAAPRRSSTASTIATRALSRPLVARRGAGKRARATSACTSASKRPPALHRHRHAGAGHRLGDPGQEQAGGIGQPDDARVGQVEAADLVGGP